MPGKIKITKEMILNCAFKITREEGIEKVNARRIGKELNCSLHPVYYSFKTMDSLRLAIIEKDKEVYNHFFYESIKVDKKRFKAIGLSYIKFAKEEKELFKLLFMRNANYTTSNMDDVEGNNLYIWNELMNEYSLTLEQAKLIHEQTWIATHGMAVMIATGFMSFNEEEISKYLANIFNGLLEEVKE